jgi:hypothetical protein
LGTQQVGAAASLHVPGRDPEIEPVLLVRDRLCHDLSARSGSCRR